ncbi:hypothetical protein [Flavisolibacter ginsenosidimutans]|uniref:Uncharacterized protein n=1 Tax=Flavisolibacter ginsenosidimutans TaxID=661481 RepID=A0A5B8ULU9_9BACT|nr:hypothetical protein [Flavisolibacter ginsenosidimutans]QEC56995.1 hypothetical protein FSB75_14160 [Flavisolibacter ginsenosidimutans]
MLKDKFYVFLLCVCFAHTLCAQQPKGYLLWSNAKRLTVDDFSIKTKSAASTPSFAQFTIDYEVNGFSFLTKNFNKKVHNYFMPAASWIDTTADIAQNLRYQQTLFDLAEIYTRQFRKALRENRKQFLKNVNIGADLNKQFISAFAQRRVMYDEETNFGTNEAKQAAWRSQIEKELTELADFAYDK